MNLNYLPNVFFLSDSVEIYHQDSTSSNLIDYGKLLISYNILSYDNNMLKIEIDGNIGYVEIDSTIYTTYNYLIPTLGEKVEKNSTDLIYEVWQNTNNLYYKIALLALNDTVSIHKYQMVSVGPYLITIPFKLNLYLNASENLQYKNPSILQLSSEEKSYLLIQIWKNIGKEYGSISISYETSKTANISSKFQIADIYEKKLSKPDSSIKYYLDIVSNYPDIPIGGDEWNSKADVYAFQKFLRLAKNQNLNEEEITKYRLQFLNLSKSKLLTAIINLQRTEILFKNKKYADAEDLWKSIISEEPLLWSSFKSSGDLRGAALLQWKKLGTKYISDDYVIESFNTIQEISTDTTILWIAKYLSIELYQNKGDTSSVFKNLEWCVIHNIKALKYEGLTLTTTTGNFLDVNVDYYINAEMAINHYKSFVKPVELKKEKRFYNKPSKSMSRNVVGADIYWLIKNQKDTPKGWKRVIVRRQVWWMEENKLSN